ncbi:DHHW family protein [Oribacterium sp. WCC10]|uniref:DHHW family protein n=1 Tax=Oribacterium sp. WCC10 TaxID=1855343 RepID=UPI0008EDEE6C|nr:DHHW family protein [Oribacterium sp. WCC10]SFG12952.1 DHHW protein [Oribacterium sp. WCC10]
MDENNKKEEIITEDLDKEADKKIQGYGAKYMTCISMLIFAAIFAVGVFAERPEYSESEKRPLEKKPEIWVTGTLTGKYFEKLDRWFSDTFPHRERLLSLESGMEAFYGSGSEAFYGNKTDAHEDTIPEVSESLAPVIELETSEASTEAETEASDLYSNLIETNADGTLKVDTEPKEEVEITGEQAGNIYVTNNKGYEIFYYNQGGSVKYASVINTVKALFPDRNVYDILVPNSFGVELDTSLQEELGSGNMPDAFNYIFSLMDPSVHRISLFDTMVEHKDEYIYFNTDHHWTGLGAYYAYRAFCEEKGITAHELSDFRYVDYTGFYGTFYFATNRSEELKDNPDHVEAWIPRGTNDAVITDESGAEFNSNIINDVTEANAGRKYNCFINGDHPFTRISNPAITDGSSCVVVKESYGNAFVPYLVDHYENVYVVDYRSYKDNLAQFIKDRNVQDIIFINNVQAITEKVSGEILSIFS